MDNTTLVRSLSSAVVQRHDSYGFTEVEIFRARIMLVSGEPLYIGSPRREKKKISYLESESSRRNNGSPLPRSSSITRGPPLIRHTIGDSIRKYQVRIQGGRVGERGRRDRGKGGGGGRGYWRIRTRAIHYESTGRILSYQSLLVSSSSSLPL